MMNFFWKVIGVQIGAHLLIGLLALIGLARLLGPPLAVDPSGQLLFLEERSEPWLSSDCGTRSYPIQSEIIRLDPVGGEPVNLTHCPANELYPALAPSGCCVAFQSDRTGDWDLYVTDLRGGPVIDLLHRPDNDSMPVWSPDGTQIAFLTFDMSHTSNLNVLDLASGQIRQLSPQDVPVNGKPAWTPDGRRIVFPTARLIDGEQRSRLFEVEVASGALTVLAEHKGALGNPVWSPDGRQVLYTARAEGVLYTVAAGQLSHRLTSADGGGLWENSTDLNYTFAPAWSPDGSQIAFQAYVDEQNAFDVFVMQADGSAIRNLTPHFGDDSTPAWSPDGTMIAFPSARDGNTEVYVMAADGSDPHRLTHTSGDDWEPHWMPALP
jgi:TolB protein